MSETQFRNYTAGEPPEDKLLDLLCEDERGKYLLPFPCICKGGAYWNPKAQNDSKPLEAKVVGWKLNRWA